MPRTGAASPLHDNAAEEKEDGSDVRPPIGAAAEEAEEAPAKPEDPVDDCVTALRPALAVSLEELERQLYDPSLVSRYLVNANKVERAKMRQLPPRMVPPWTFDIDGPKKDASSESPTENPTTPIATCDAAALTSTKAHMKTKGTNQDQSESSSAGKRGLPEVSNQLPIDDTDMAGNLPHVDRDLDHRQAAAAACVLYGEAIDEQEPRCLGNRDGSDTTDEPGTGDNENSLELDKPSKRRRSKDRERRRSRSRKKKSRRRKKKRDRRDREDSDANSIRSDEDDSSDSTSTSESSRMRKKRRKKTKRRRRRQRDDSDSASEASRDS